MAKKPQNQQKCQGGKKGAAGADNNAPESSQKSNGGLLSRRGGFRENAGRKPDEVKAIERKVLETMRKQMSTGKEVSLIEGCVARLWEIAQQSEDLGAAVKANDSLLNRYCGKPAQKIELEGDDRKFNIQIVPILATGAPALPAGA
jgi:hypothetical protein